jgi:hypothetical protein
MNSWLASARSLQRRRWIKAVLVRAAFGADGAGRGLFRFLLLFGWRFSLLLMPRLPAVGDFGQDLADTFDIGVSPESNTHPGYLCDRWFWNLA